MSSVSQEESASDSFYNSSGAKTDPFVLLKNLGVNTIRLRVWVNPSGGWCNGADTLYKAKRAMAQGQKIMPVIVAETGMDWQQARAAKAMLADVMTRLTALGSNGLGVLYWEPQAYPGWQGYTWGALNGSGYFTIALDPF